MPTSHLAGLWQQTLVLTSLLVNGSDFAAISSSRPSNMPPTLTSSSIISLSQVTLSPSVDIGAPLLPNIYDREAHDAQEVCSGYGTASHSLELSPQLVHLLSLIEPCNVYGNDVDALNVSHSCQTRNRYKLDIRPAHLSSANESWFDLPEEWLHIPGASDEDIKPTSSCSEQSQLELQITTEPSFGWEVLRVQEDGTHVSETLFSTMGNVLVFEDQFFEFVLNMPESYNVYGLGEVIHGLRLQPGLTRTIWAGDNGDPIDGNIYGSHPFLMETRFYRRDPESGEEILVTDEEFSDDHNYTSRSHGMYLRNAHAQEVIMGKQNITWRGLGGSLEMYFFAGPTQADVISQYQEAVGKPVMQQYWTFGYHQCRWGYENWSMTEEVVNNFAKFEIPLETIWNDIDYMKGYRDFTVDPVRFSYEEGNEFLNRLHENGQHYVPIVDAAIYIPNPENESDAYPVFNDGNNTGSFLLNPDGSLYIGAVWPGFTVFPDWLSQSASRWWRRTVASWHHKLPFDGLWIDMSEVSSFCVGSCGSHNLSQNPVHPPFKLPGEEDNIIFDYPEGFNVTNGTEAAIASSASATQQAARISTSTSQTSYLRTTPTPGQRNVNHPPYVINNAQGDLAVHAVSPNATHHNGVREYDVHNLYGHQLLRNTYAAISAAMPGKRPFIIGRSTFAGSGTYAGHWGGDNYSKWIYMYFSIPQALSFSMFGIPMFGVDTCGFAGNSDEELCNRWMQLSAFFPFYRNHNTLSANSQEPYVWGSVIEATKIAMNIRFQLLPYMYTLFHHAHVHGTTVMRALAWDFPNDPRLAQADRQFFLGSGIMVVPVLTQGQTTVDGVFPGLREGKEIYYDWYNQSEVAVPSTWNTTIDAPLGHIPVYIRGGVVLATQEMRRTTREARKTDWSIIIALNRYEAGDKAVVRASGSLYLDDGESIDPGWQESKEVSFNVTTVDAIENGKNTTQLRLAVSPSDSTFTALDNPLANITILGVDRPIDHQVQIHNTTVSTIEYFPGTQKMVIYGLQDVLPRGAWGQPWEMSVMFSAG